MCCSPASSCGLGTLTRMLLILRAQLSETLMLCLLKMGLYLRELVKCLYINLRNVLPIGVFSVKREVGSKPNGISTDLPFCMLASCLVCGKTCMGTQVEHDI